MKKHLPEQNNLFVIRLLFICLFVLFAAHHLITAISFFILQVRVFSIQYFCHPISAHNKISYHKKLKLNSSTFFRYYPLTFTERMTADICGVDIWVLIPMKKIPQEEYLLIIPDSDFLTHFRLKPCECRESGQHRLALYVQCYYLYHLCVL